MSGWIIETLIASTLLMLVVLAVREPVSRRFGPRIAYALWLLPALRMVLPPLPESWGAAAVAPAVQVSILIGQAAPVVEAGTNWVLIFAAVWAMGSLAFLCWHLSAYRRFASRIRQDCEPLCDHEAFPVQASRLVRSPLAFGVRGKMVVVPADFADRYDAAEQKFALAHEVTHHRRGDLIANLAGLCVLALHWFNPVAHIAWRAFRLDQEAACDAMVLCGASSEDRHAYGLALVKSATGGVPLAACTMTAKTGLKTRLRRIVEGRLAPMRGGAAVAGLLVVGGLAVTASTGIAAEAVRKVETSVPMLALNEVVLVHDLPDPAVIEAKIQADHVQAKAEVTRARADAQAEIDRAAAAGHLSAADVAEAKADLDQELAEGLADAQEALEEARRDAEAARTEAEAARADAEAQSHARPISTAISSAMPARCGKGATLSSFVQQVALPDGPTRVLRVAVCKPDAKATRAMVRQSLAQARAQIAGDPMIPADLRQSILTALDVRMEDEPAHLPLS
jgi:beta-lactamase regulating signal transducer with metallopeptidase domain